MAKPCQGLDENPMALTRHQALHTKQRPGWASPWSEIGGRLCRPWRNNADPVGGDAVPRDGDGGSLAGTEHAAEPRQHSSLDPSRSLRFGPREARFLGQRVVDKGDES